MRLTNSKEKTLILQLSSDDQPLTGRMSLRPFRSVCITASCFTTIFQSKEKYVKSGTWHDKRCLKTRNKNIQSTI